METKNKKTKGSSLLEALIYSTILILMTLALIQSLMVMMNSYQNVKIHQVINISASESMERMVREIRLANDIDDTGSSFSVSDGKLKINTEDSGGSPLTLEFFLSGTGVYAKEGSLAPEALTSSSTEVTSLIFNKITASSTLNAVKIILTIKAKSGKIERTEKFYDTAILRGSY